MQIPLSDPNIGPCEVEAVKDVLKSGNLKAGGKYDKKCADLLESAFDIPRVMMTTSCTHALEMAAFLLDVGVGDEVILPSFTFPSTATAFARTGARLTFCEVRPNTLNMDPNHLRDIVDDDTDVIVPVHYAGVGAQMDKILDIANEHKVAVVEDAAQAVNATYRGDSLGTLGDIGCYSFHETKNYSAGEGGAIALNDEGYVERAEFIRHKGTNYEQFRRGEVPKYSWVDHGSSYGPSEMQSALAYTQLQRRDEFRNARRNMWQFYHGELEELERSQNITLPKIPDGRESNYHIFFIICNSTNERDQLLGHLREQGIGAASHYEPLHSSKMGQSFGYQSNDLPRTMDLASRLLRLPLGAHLDDRNLHTVVQGVMSFY